VADLVLANSLLAGLRLGFFDCLLDPLGERLSERLYLLRA
jgi:hypothetical protein